MKSDINGHTHAFAYTTRTIILFDEDGDDDDDRFVVVLNVLSGCVVDTI